MSHVHKLVEALHDFSECRVETPLSLSDVRRPNHSISIGFTVHIPTAMIADGLSLSDVRQPNHSISIGFTVHIPTAMIADGQQELILPLTREAHI